MVYKDKPTNWYFFTNDEHVYVNSNQMSHANFKMHVVNFTDE